MNNMDNLHSYDNVEYLQAHVFTERELLEYCQLKMQTAQSNTNFIAEYIWGGYSLNVCEIGGGNGKLLYCLERRGMLQKGINYEVSKNRCELAIKFAGILSSKCVEVRNRNFLADTAELNQYDCIVMVDIVMQIISPLYDSAEADTIEWVYKSLKQGGCLFMEIVDYSNVLKRIEREGEMFTWEEFPQDDPFEYSLQKFYKDNDKNLVCEKRFIGRNNGKRDYIKNVIRSYTVEEITHILQGKGFETTVFSCHEDSMNESERNATYRILAKKV